MKIDLDRDGALENLQAKWASERESEKPNAHLLPDPSAAPAGPMPNAGTILTRRVSEIEAKPVSWLWHRRIPRGKLTILAGNPGLGKSQITASIAAVITAGGFWPGDGGSSVTGDVLFMTAEDDAADTLRPRLEAAGANLARVHIVESVVVAYTGEGTRQRRVFSLERDVPSLSDKLAELRNVAAVFIDPISAYLGNIDSHKNAEVRSLLTPLSEVAAQHSIAIIGVSHLSKAAGAEAMMRISGSLAFVAAARAAYLVAHDPNDKGRRLFLPIKNNLAPDTGGLAYRIEGATVNSNVGTVETSYVIWEPGAVTITADEVMLSNASPKTSALDEAKDWLQDLLALGPMFAAEVFKRASGAGISEKTARRASKELGITPKKAGMNGGWTWDLPPKMAKGSEDAQE